MQSLSAVRGARRLETDGPASSTADRHCHTYPPPPHTHVPAWPGLAWPGRSVSAHVALSRHHSRSTSHQSFCTEYSVLLCKTISPNSSVIHLAYTSSISTAAVLRDWLHSQQHHTAQSVTRSNVQLPRFTFNSLPAGLIACSSK